jgi:hypothetical protein
VRFVIYPFRTCGRQLKENKVAQGSRACKIKEIIPFLKQSPRFFNSELASQCCAGDVLTRIGLKLSCVFMNSVPPAFDQRDGREH